MKKSILYGKVTDENYRDEYISQKLWETDNYNYPDGADPVRAPLVCDSLIYRKYESGSDPYNIWYLSDIDGDKNDGEWLMDELIPTGPTCSCEPGYKGTS